MESRFPYVDIDSLNFVDRTAETFIREPKRLANYDLVVSATGNPTIDLEINDVLYKQEKAPPFVVCFNEPYGIGGHAIAVLRNGGCLRCLYSDPLSGEIVAFQGSFVKDGQSFSKTISGCSSAFVEYSVLDSQQTAVMASRLIIDVLKGKCEHTRLISWVGSAERLCDVDSIDTAKAYIDEKVKRYIADTDENEIYAAFIMALIPLGCYLGYAIGNKVPVQTYQHFRDTEDWIWRDEGENIMIEYPNVSAPCSDVNLFINISGVVDSNLVYADYPIYAINAKTPGFSFLQSWKQVQEFRKLYREVLDKIREDNGESVVVHLYPATPNPINFEIGKGIMKDLDPTIILYDKTERETEYKEVMHLHDRVRESG